MEWYIGKEQENLINILIEWIRKKLDKAIGRTKLSGIVEKKITLTKNRDLKSGYTV